MGLDRAAAWVAGYLTVGLVLFHAGLVSADGPDVAPVLWLPTKFALDAATEVQAAVAPQLAGPVARWSLVTVGLAAEGLALVAGWGLLRLGGRRLAVALGNP